MQSVVQKALRQIDIAQEAAAAELEDLDRQAAEAMLQGRWDLAVSTLQRAAALAAETETAESLAREQLLTTARLRRDDAVDLRASAPAPNGGTARKHALQKGHNRSKPTPARKGGRGRDGPSEAGGKGGGPPRATAPDVAAAATKAGAADLVQRAAGLRARNAWFDAIVAYMRAARLDPTNPEARRALAELEPQRQTCIRESLKTAQEHFLRQDLAGAVPHYRRVLLLAPDNEQAQDGLRMHENLERIRRERQVIRP
jgi:tetratricopeptide (TPR) repeat protein